MPWAGMHAALFSFRILLPAGAFIMPLPIAPALDLAYLCANKAVRSIYVRDTARRNDPRQTPAAGGNRKIRRLKRISYGLRIFSLTKTRGQR